MKDIGFLSKDHLQKYLEARTEEALKEGIMKYPFLAKEKVLRDIYTLGFVDAIKCIGDTCADINMLTNEEGLNNGVVSEKDNQSN